MNRLHGFFMPLLFPPRLLVSLVNSTVQDVAKQYRNGLESLRKQEGKRLEQTLAAEAYGEVKGAMWALRKPEEPLTAEEQHVLGALFTYSPDLQLDLTGYALFACKIT